MESGSEDAFFKWLADNGVHHKTRLGTNSEGIRGLFATEDLHLRDMCGSPGTKEVIRVPNKLIISPYHIKT